MLAPTSSTDRLLLLLPATALAIATLATPEVTSMLSASLRPTVDLLTSVAADAVALSVVSLACCCCCCSPPSMSSPWRALTLALLLPLLLWPGSPLFLSLTWQWQKAHPVAPEGGGEWNKLRVVPSHRLLFCVIDKNANTAFEDLLCSLARDSQPAWLRWAASVWRTWADFELGCQWEATSPTRMGMSLAEARAAFERRTPGWTSAVFVRDPLERFLSGWLSKCTDGHDPDREVCSDVFGAPNASFAQAVATISALEGDLPEGWAQAHFRLQSSFCGGAVGRRGAFDLVYVLDRSTSRRDVADMLARVGVPKPSRATRAFDYHFGAPLGDAAPPRPSDAAAPRPSDTPPAGLGGGSFAHVTAAASHLSQYYSEVSLVRAVLAHYAPDYRLVPGLRVPAWAVDAVGEPYVRSLGLESEPPPRTHPQP